MRIIHVTHPNGEEAVILTTRHPSTSAKDIATEFFGHLGTHNTVTTYVINDPVFPEWPLDLPTDQALRPIR